MEERVLKELQSTSKKPENKARNKRMVYSKKNIDLALQEVRKGNPVATTARKYNIPEATLRAKKDNKYANKKPGPSTILSEEEEKVLFEWILERCKAGFPVTKLNLLESVQQLCENMGRKNPFKNNKPGRSWYESFLKRHPKISLRISKNVCTNRAKVSEKSLQEWFKGVSKYLESKDLLSIEGDRIFNCDETDVIKKKEEKLKKEQQRIERENEKLMKQQKKMKELEKKRKETEDILMKEKEKRIEELEKKRDEIRSH